MGTNTAKEVGTLMEQDETAVQYKTNVSQPDAGIEIGSIDWQFSMLYQLATETPFFFPSLLMFFFFFFFFFFYFFVTLYIQYNLNKGSDS